MPLWITCLACFFAGMLSTTVLALVFSAWKEKARRGEWAALHRDNERMARRLEAEQQRQRFRRSLDRAGDLPRRRSRGQFEHV